MNPSFFFGEGRLAIALPSTDLVYPRLKKQAHASETKETARCHVCFLYKLFPKIVESLMHAGARKQCSNLFISNRTLLVPVAQTGWEELWY